MNLFIYCYYIKYIYIHFKIMLKYYWVSFQIFYLKHILNIKNRIEKIKEKRLRRFVNSQILMSCNYDFEVLKILYNIK
jgi:hypothetical protein